MAEKKVATTTAKDKKVAAKAPSLPLFEKQNYLWMIIGGVIVAVGMLLMMGGKNQDPNTFDKDVVYSFTRITIAPILIILGLAIEIYAIFKRPKLQP